MTVTAERKSTNEPTAGDSEKSPSSSSLFMNHLPTSKVPSNESIDFPRGTRADLSLVTAPLLNRVTSYSLMPEKQSGIDEKKRKYATTDDSSTEGMYSRLRSRSAASQSSEQHTTVSAASSSASSASSRAAGGGAVGRKKKTSQ